jgi:hypothetical protein
MNKIKFKKKQTKSLVDTRQVSAEVDREKKKAEKGCIFL